MMLKEKGLAWEIQKALQMLENPEEGGKRKKLQDLLCSISSEVSMA